MTWRSTRVNALKFIDVPDGIPVGVVIGKGGCQVKELKTKHGVRCKADFDTRKVLVTGSREGVDAATREIYELFDQWRVERDECVRAREAKTLGLVVHTVHKNAVVQQHEKSGWYFAYRDEENTAADPSVMDSGYRLMETDILSENAHREEGDAEDSQHSWIFPFNKSFQQHMLDDVAKIAAADPSVLKFKAAFGLQCFAIPDANTASGDALSWNKLRALQLYSQIKPRWSNTLNARSDILATLLDNLETQFDVSTTFKTDLVVYVNKRHGNRGDVSNKFRWENGEWVVVQRKPVRVVHALYNIAMDNETAFRLRVYSRLEPPSSLDYEELVNSLHITTASTRDPFTTTVTAGHDFPANLCIRSFAVRESVNVECRKMRFTISYMDPQRKVASLSCRLLDAETMAPVEAMESLLNGVLSFIN